MLNKYTDLNIDINKYSDQRPCVNKPTAIAPIVTSRSNVTDSSNTFLSIHHVTWIPSKLHQAVREANGIFRHSNIRFVEIVATTVFHCGENKTLSYESYNCTRGCFFNVYAVMEFVSHT